MKKRTKFQDHTTKSYTLTSSNASYLSGRSEWEGDIAPYSPRFQDGWSPGIISFFDDDNFDFGQDNNEEFVLRKMSKDRVRICLPQAEMRLSGPAHTLP